MRALKKEKKRRRRKKGATTTASYRSTRWIRFSSLLERCQMYRWRSVLDACAGCVRNKCTDHLFKRIFIKIGRSHLFRDGLRQLVTIIINAYFLGFCPFLYALGWFEQAPMHLPRSPSPSALVDWRHSMPVPIKNDEWMPLFMHITRNTPSSRLYL